MKTEIHFVEKAACVVGREGLNFCIFDERHVAVVGIELGCHREFRVWYLGESRRYLH